MAREATVRCGIAISQSQLRLFELESVSCLYEILSLPRVLRIFSVDFTVHFTVVVLINDDNRSLIFTFYSWISV